MISGRNAIDLAYEPPSILDWALPLIKQGKLNEVLDKKIPLPGNFKPIKQMINLAIKCVRTSRYRRPSMSDVVEELKDSYRKVQLSSLDSISRVVRRNVSAQRPWPANASTRRAKVSSYPHHKRLLSQVSRLAESVPAAPADEITPEPAPFAADYSEVESEAALEDFMSANASFRSSSASASIDLTTKTCASTTQSRVRIG